MSKLSESFSQLSNIFECLEVARYQENKDFGANVAGCFEWYLSPPAVQFLEKRLNPHWMAIKYNQRFKWEMLPWHGYEGKGVSIKFVV